MNGDQLTPVELEKALAEKLRELLERDPVVRDLKILTNPGVSQRVFDIRATWPLPTGGRAELWVDCHADPRPSQFPYAAFQQRFDSNKKRVFVQVPVFAAPFISPRMAEVCWKHHWSWFDLAGNCRLCVPGALYIERTGFEPVHTRPRPTANLSTPEAARIIRALLAPANAIEVWTQRKLVLHFHELQMAEPSLGLVNKVVQHLRDEGFIKKHQTGGFLLRDPLGLLAVWRAAYRFDRHLRRSYFTLLQGPQLVGLLLHLQLELQSKVPGGRAAYAAFSAAEIQAPHVRQPKIWLYVNSEAEEKFREVVEAKPVDSGENLVVLIPEDDGVFYPSGDSVVDEDGDPIPRFACTNAVQTYVDLCHCGGRGEEAAEALLEQKLKPAWKAKGLLRET
ncbi:MAG: hypothetical protein ACLPT4_12395 [Verrucomicrobiia bacterium]